MPPLPQIHLPFRIRQSTLEDARCLYRFHKKNILGLKEPDSEAADRGNHVHALAKQYVDFLKGSNQESDWSYAAELIAEGDWNPEAASLFRNWVRQRSFDPARIFATEYKVRLDWNLQSCDDADAVYSADIDRLEIVGRVAELCDLKTHWGVFEPTTIQSIIYPWMLWKVMPHLEKINFNLEFIRWGITKTRTFDRDHLETMDRYIDNQVTRLLAAVEEDDWPASVNSKCVYCHLDCPLVAAGLTRNAVGQIQSPEQAKQLAQELFALARSYKQTHALLKAYAMEHGSIDAGNDIRLGFAKRDKFAYDVESVVKLNEQHGFHPRRALGVVPAEVKKIGRKYPEYVMAARAAARDKSTTVFKFWNQIGDPLDEDEEDEQ